MAVEESADRNLVFAVDRYLTAITIDITAMMDKRAVTHVEDAPANSVV